MSAKYSNLNVAKVEDIQTGTDVPAFVRFASMAVPMYISESAPAKFRGSLGECEKNTSNTMSFHNEFPGAAISVVCNTLMITFGQFVAGCVCGGFSGVRPHGWKWMLGLAGVPSAIQFVGFMFMPESPRWLLSKGHVDKARAVLSKTLDAGIEQVEYEVSQIQAS